MRATRVARSALGALFLIFAASLAVSTADAQIGRREPVDKPGYGGGFTSFTVVSIPQFPDFARLGALSVGDNGDLYVWAVSRVPRSSVTPDDPRRELDQPGDRGGGFDVTIVSSTLYRLSGDVWSTALELPGEYGASVLAVGKHVYAATNLPDGTVRMHRFDGKHWRVDKMDKDVVGPAGMIVGDRHAVYFRSGCSILERHGKKWHVEFASEDIAKGSALAFVSRDEVYAPCCQGQMVFNGKRWKWQPSAPRADIHGAWADRDAAGELHLFKAGSDAFNGGPCLWQFVEDREGSRTGAYDLTRDDTAISHGPGCGHATWLWGAGVHDVLAAGSCCGTGLVFTFDGATWVRGTPLTPMPLVSGIGGMPSGEAWIGLVDGRLLHRAAREPVALPSPGIVAPAADVAPVGAPRVSVALAREPAGAVTVEFTLAAAADVTVTVHDLAGRCVTTLERARRDAGVHHVRWAADVAPGVYFCVVRADGVLVSKPAIVLR